MTRPIPEALLERYLAGDLSGDAKAALERRLESEPAERARLEALRADSAAFLVSHPPGRTVAKLSAPKARPTWLLALFGSLGAVTASLVFVLLRAEREPEVGLKGDVAVAIYRQTDTGSERVEPGAALHEGDRIRFDVRTGKDGWLAIVARDGRGAVTVYYPAEGMAAARYRAAEPLLPGAIGLDDSTGIEEAWVLFATKPFTVTSTVEQLQRGEVPAAEGLNVSSVRWSKAPRP